MNFLATFFALVVQKLGPWLYGVLADLVVKTVDYFQRKKKEREDKKLIDDLLEKERNAKSAKDQEDAFKDYVDKSDSD